MELQIKQWLHNQSYTENRLSMYNIRTTCQAWLLSDACKQKEAFLIKALLQLIASPESTPVSIESHLRTLLYMLTVPAIWADDVDSSEEDVKHPVCVVA